MGHLRVLGSWVITFFKTFRAPANGQAAFIFKLKTGDVLIVVRLDRLARSTRDLLNVLAELAERGAAFRSISDTWADTTTPRPAGRHLTLRLRIRRVAARDVLEHCIVGFWGRARGCERGFSVRHIRADYDGAI